MALKRILATTLFLICLLITLSVENVEAGSLVVRSVPAGAQVVLTGEVVLSGVTPVVFDQTLIGDYKLEIKKYGFETYETRIVLDPSKITEVDAALSKKTRFKAAARSFLVPGWGQQYASKKAKGVLFTTLTVGAVVAFLIADADFDDKRESYLAKRDEYDETSRSGTYEELVRLHAELGVRRTRAYDAESWRRVSIGAVIAVWGINMLDIVMFFPEERGAFSVKGITIAPSASPEMTGLTLSMEF